MVPIVFGPHRDDVNAVAPPNSYIFAEDFKDVNDLVQYVDYLDRNNTAYIEYHTWRNLYPEGNYTNNDTYFTLGNEEQSYCDLCRLIRAKRKENHPHQHYKSVLTHVRFIRTIENIRYIFCDVLYNLLSYTPVTYYTVGDEILEV